MIITNKKNLSLELLAVKIDGQVLEIVDEVKYLGITIDKRLSFNSHIENVTKKMSKKFGIICKLNKSLTQWSKITLYKTLVGPHIDYCSTILFLGNQGQIDDMQIIQNKFMRLILQCDQYTSIRRMADALGWLTVKQRIYYNTLLFVRRIKHKLVPEYLHRNIRYGYEIHGHQTRNRIQMLRDPASLASTQNSLFFKGVDLYNKLPASLRNDSNINNFKRGCLQYVKENYF